MAWLHRAAPVLALLLLAGCGSDAAVVAVDPDHGDGTDGGSVADGASRETTDGSSNNDASPDAAKPELPDATPITAPSGTWTWVGFPSAVCDDGTSTGIGVNLNPASDQLVVFFQGGGACWDYTTCAVISTSTHGPFGAPQLPLATRGLGGSTLDRATAANPFKDYNAVFVPYCTGDIHAGDTVTTYTAGAASKVVHHKGHANALAYIALLAATFPKPSQIAVTGSSAGGGGALFNYASFRAAWPTTPMLLIDDSLPLFEGTTVPTSLRTAWYQSWNLAPLVDPICTGCKDDFSLYLTSLAKKFPNDRMALLSSEQDGTIRTFYQLSGPAYAAALKKLTADVLDPLGNFKHFFVNGQTHTMLGGPAMFTANSTPLWSWLTQMVTDDPTWKSVDP